MYTNWYKNDSRFCVTVSTPSLFEIFKIKIYHHQWLLNYTYIDPTYIHDWYSKCALPRVFQLYLHDRPYVGKLRSQCYVGKLRSANHYRIIPM